MRGYEKLIELRRAHKAPRFVFVNDYPCRTDWHENAGDAVTVCTAGDDIDLLDLRCLVGLRVSISSPAEARAKALFERCKDAGAATVAACHVLGWGDGWAEVWHRKEVA